MKKLEVVEFSGEAKCSKCGCAMRGDQGYKLSDGSYVCREGDKCSIRVNADPSAPKRWRK